MAKPIPVPDDVSRPFWEAARVGRLVAQRCSECGEYQHPPGKQCRFCQSTRLEFVPLSGKGTVNTFTIVEDTRVQGLIPFQPFALVAVELEESPQLIMLGNIRAGEGTLQIGQPVEVEFESIAPGEVLPQFRVTKSVTAPTGS